MAGYAKDFKDLEVYEWQQRVSLQVYQLSRSFPPDERYSLTDQIRRAVRSIGAQIAEAWGKRRYPKHFASKLSDGLSETLETRHWLTEALNCKYINQTQKHEIEVPLVSIAKMLNSMILKAESFCTTNPDLYISEEEAEYISLSSNNEDIQDGY